jgi:hypothetical protein
VLDTPQWQSTRYSRSNELQRNSKRSVENVLNKKIAAFASIASIALAGSATAADDFTTLAGVSAEPMTVIELDAVRGARDIVVVPPSGYAFGTMEIIPGYADYDAAHMAVYATEEYGMSTIQHD